MNDSTRAAGNCELPEPADQVDTSLHAPRARPPVEADDEFPIDDPASESRRSWRVTCGECLIHQTMRHGETAEGVIRAELANLDRGRTHRLERGTTAEAWAAGEDERAVWDNHNRLVATIRPRAHGEPEVVRFTPDGPVVASEGPPREGPRRRADDDAAR